MTKGAVGEKLQKSAKCHRLNTAKCYENSEYTIEYTKHITSTY